MWITSSLKAAKAPTNIALGNFDGVHLGHQQVMTRILSGEQTSVLPYLDHHAVTTLHDGTLTTGYSQWPIDCAVDSASQLPIGPELQSSGAYSTVVTFSPHPHEYFSGVSRPLLTPVAEKTWQLARLGIHQLIMLPFNQALAELSPQNFVEKVLIKGLHAQRISVGSDFHFGKGRSGNAQKLMEIAAAHNVPVIQVPLKYEQGDRISSSRIREALQSGQPNIATKLLGRPYTLTGKVVKGQQLGRTIGFPTANLKVPSNKYLPRTGVYSVWVYGVADCPLRGVMNIGHRPTVQGQDLSIEIHLLEWAGDLYQKSLTVSLETFIRTEQKFDSLDQLKTQISIDCEQAASTLSPA
ncbi:MAG: bifunctional riboflavin kinase/FAD synthetase [Phormidesmis sp.]